MTYRELRRSDLLDALFALEREEDINRVSRYFRSATGSSAQYACSGALGQQQTCTMLAAAAWGPSAAALS